MRYAAPTRQVLGFVVWLLAGGSVAVLFLGAFSIVSLWALATGVVATAVALRIRAGRVCVLGCVSGAGLPLFFVAWVNRSGPGEVCVTTSAMVNCMQELSPWPWLVAAVALFLAGIGVFLKRAGR